MVTPHYKKVGSGAKTILFLHGIGGNQNSFDDQMADLQTGWQALVWDMPGYNGSPSVPEMTFETLADAAIKVLDGEDVSQAVIVGHSMGGMVAQEIVARYPQRVSALVLFATTSAFGGKDESFTQAFLADRLKPLDEGKTPADIAPSLVGAMFGDATVDSVRANAAKSMAAVSSEAYRAALNCIVTFNRRESLAAITCPTLVLAAENDRLSPPKTMSRMAEKIPGATYVCLPGLGHLANFEAPEIFNTALNKFLSTVS